MRGVGSNGWLNPYFGSYSKLAKNKTFGLFFSQHILETLVFGGVRDFLVGPHGSHFMGFFRTIKILRVSDILGV